MVKYIVVGHILAHSNVLAMLFSLDRNRIRTICSHGYRSIPECLSDVHAYLVTAKRGANIPNSISQARQFLTHDNAEHRNAKRASSIMFMWLFKSQMQFYSMKIAMHTFCWIFRYSFSWNLSKSPTRRQFNFDDLRHWTRFHMK